MERGRIALHTGHAADAETWLRQALAVDPSDRRSSYLLYQCLRSQGKDDEAKKQKDQADRVLADLTRLGILFEELVRAPNDPALHYELGVLYSRNGEELKGVRWFFSTLKLDPNHKPAHEALAAYYERIGDKERAAEHRRQAGQ